MSVQRYKKDLKKPNEIKKREGNVQLNTLSLLSCISAFVVEEIQQICLISVKHMEIYVLI